MPRLRVLFVASECVPFAKTGGLGDVVGALPLALAERGHDVRVVLPLYQSVRKFAGDQLSGTLGVPFHHATRFAAVRRTQIPNPGRPDCEPPVYLLEYDNFFDRAGVYGDSNGEFGDNLARYGFLSRGALELCHYLGFMPDVIHVHDWPTTLIPVYLNTLLQGSQLSHAATVLSIHNLGYQGWFAMSKLGESGLGLHHAHTLEMHGQINLLKAGLVHSTMVSTVSPKYALEIQSRAGGEGLDGILAMRHDPVVGILNGIDTNVWNPAADKHTAAPFSASDLSGKALCKAALQREMGLPQEPRAPLIGMVSRLAGQKGIDVFAKALDGILAMGAQVVVLGSGESWAESEFAYRSHHHPRFRAFLGMNDALAHRIEAGADFFMMPSRYEPCGLNQMYSQRYGTLPIVRSVGGLDDTVQNGETGFKFDDLTPQAIENTTRWALGMYHNDPARLRAMQIRSMQKPLGWDNAARQYEALYRLAARRRQAELGRR